MALILMSLAEDDGSRAANSNINEKNVCPAAVRKDTRGKKAAKATAPATTAQVIQASAFLFIFIFRIFSAFFYNVKVASLLGLQTFA